MPPNRANTPTNSIRPKTDSTRIVFPWVVDRFTKQEFKPSLLQNKAKEEHIDFVLEELKKSKYYNEVPRIDYNYIAVMAIIVTGFIVGFGFFFYAVLTGISPSNFMFFGPLGLMIVMILAVCIVPSLVELGRITTARKRREDFLAILKPINMKYEKSGMQWRVGKGGLWLCLELNFELVRMVESVHRSVLGSNDAEKRTPFD